MYSPDPFTVVSMIGGLRGAWRARALGLPIALAGWRAMVGFCASSLLGGRVGPAPTAAPATLWIAPYGPRLSRTPGWAAYGMVGLLTIGTPAGAHAEDVVPVAVDAPDSAGAGSKPLWEAGIGGFAGAVADYPGSNQYRVRGLPLPFFIYRDVDDYDGAVNVDSSLLRTRRDLGAAVGFAWSIGQSKQAVNRAR